MLFGKLLFSNVLMHIHNIGLRNPSVNSILNFPFFKRNGLSYGLTRKINDLRSTQDLRQHFIIYVTF